MVNRAIGPAIVVFWLAAMTWLIWHDVVPVWIAQDPPDPVSPEWVAGERRRQQAHIEDKHGGHIGRIWTVYSRAGETTARQDLIVIERFPPISPARIAVDAQFDAEGRLDELSADILITGSHFALQAERYGTQLAFELRAGPRRQTFKLTDTDAGMIGDLFKPFSAMPNLEVGQTWRMQVFNPLSAVIGQGQKFIPMIVRVTGEEVLHTPDGPERCLIVEAPSARALVSRDGTVRVQEIELPIGGKIVIRDEPFDVDEYEEARHQTAARRSEASD